MASRRLPLEHSITLSTSHVPSSDPDFGDIRVTEHDFGWIVFVSKFYVHENVPSWLRPILRAALDNGCTIVNFDRDAGQVEGFAIYHW